MFGAAPRQRDRFSMEILQSVLQGRAVMFGHDSFAYLDPIVGFDRQHVRIEGAVVDRTHCDAVRDHRLATVRVLLDVSGIEQPRVAKAAERAL